MSLALQGRVVISLALHGGGVMSDALHGGVMLLAGGVTVLWLQVDGREGASRRRVWYRTRLRR